MTAKEIAEMVRKAFPEAEIAFESDSRRQKIIDSWPGDLNDNAAKADWNWSPEYDLTRAFEEYLIPNISKRYQVRNKS